MQRRTSRLAALAAAVALATGLAACNKNDQEAAKAEADSAIARTEQATRDAQTRMAEAASEARQATTEMGRDIRQSAEQAASDAKAAAASAGDAIDDVAITASVSAGLAKDLDLSALRINVDTQDGVVSLNGPAPSATAKERAETIAKAVKGVKSVQNHLTVGG